MGSAIFNLFMVYILQNTKPEYPNNLPSYYESLKMQGGVLKTYFAPHSPKISIAPVEPNEYLEGIFESRNISNFMTLDNLANLSAIKKLLVSLQTQTSKIQQIITKLEKKKSKSVKLNRISFLRNKYPKYFTSK